MTSDLLFPPENINPEEKTHPLYGAQYAYAAYHNFKRRGGDLFLNATERYKHLTDLAQGEQSLDTVKGLSGHYAGEDGENEGLAFIDFQTLNLAPKFINLVLGKLNKIQYDITLEAVDALASDHKAEYEAKAKTVVELKSFLEQYVEGYQRLFAGIDIADLPSEPDELAIKLNMTYKHWAAMEGEMKLKQAHIRNNWPQIAKEIGWDIVTLGVGVVSVWEDMNGVEREKRIDPDKFFCSSSESEAFEDLEYAGYLEHITPNQFRREVSGELSEIQIEEVISNFASSRGTNYNDSFSNQDGLGYIPVVRFQFLTENTEKYVIRQNSRGNLKIERKAWDFIPADAELKFYESGEKELVPITYTAKYGGTWVMDSEICYNYGLVNSNYKDDDDLVNEKLDFIIHAPNMKKGKVVSMLSQMEEPIKMINIAWNKVKSILAKGRMGALRLNIAGLASVAMGKGGKTWGPRQVYEFFEQTNVLIENTPPNAYGQSPGQSITEVNMGLTLMDYINTIRLSIEQVQNITGINELSDGSTPAPRTGVGVMNMANSSTNNALDYIFTAYKSIYERASWAVLSMIKRKDPRLNIHKFGLFISPKPTEQEWERLYATLDNAVAAGTIDASDAIFIRHIDNLKQAEQTFIVREKKRRRERMEEAEMATKQNMESQMASNKQATDNQILLINTEWDRKDQHEMLKMEGTLQVQDKKNASAAEVKNLDVYGKVESTKQSGKDALIKRAQENLSQDYKTDKQHEAALIAAKNKSKE